MTYDATQVGILIAAVAAAIVTIINAWSNRTRAIEVKTKLEENSKEVTTKLNEIHTSTNGTLSELRKEIISLREKALADKGTVEALKEVAALKEEATNKNK
jgi:signal transduction histidine kinase